MPRTRSACFYYTFVYVVMLCLVGDVSVLVFFEIMLDFHVNLNNNAATEAALLLHNFLLSAAGIHAGCQNSSLWCRKKQNPNMLTNTLSTGQDAIEENKPSNYKPMIPWYRKLGKHF